MSSMGVRHAFVLAALVGPLLAGCSTDDSGPDATDASSHVGPTLPPAMSRGDVVGAKAFIRYFWAVTNHAEATGDTSMLEKLAAGSCAACAEQSSRIDQVYAAEGSMEGGKHVVEGQQPLARGDDPSAYSVIVDLRTARQEVVESDGATPLVRRKRYETLRFDVRYDEGQWLMVGWHDQEVE